MLSHRIFRLMMGDAVVLLMVLAVVSILIHLLGLAPPLLDFIQATPIVHSLLLALPIILVVFTGLSIYHCIQFEQEITSHQQAEDTLQYYPTLLDIINDAVVSTNQDRHILSWNKGAERLYGWTAEEVIGKRYREIIPIDASEQNEAEISANLLKEGKWQGEIVQYHRDGRKLHIHSASNLIRDDAGNMIGGVTVCRDLGDLKLYEENQLQLTLAHERRRLLNRFIQDVSHQFRTPLTILNTSLYLVRNITDEAQRQRRFDTIQEQSDALLSLVDSLSTSVELDNPKNIETVACNMNQLLAQACHHFETEFTRKQLTLAQIFKEGLPTLRGDSLYLQMALQNVIQNAIHFTPEGGTITIKSCFKAEQNQLVISIQDTGIGIASEDLPHIFERFYQADHTGTARGFGLGLSITKQIIETHGGTIEVDSELGKGSNFRVILPRR